jgi:anti-sigma B factor antagonist
MNFAWLASVGRSYYDFHFRRWRLRHAYFGLTVVLVFLYGLLGQILLGRDPMRVAAECGVLAVCGLVIAPILQIIVVERATATQVASLASKDDVSLASSPPNSEASDWAAKHEEVEARLNAYAQGYAQGLAQTGLGDTYASSHLLRLIPFSLSLDKAESAYRQGRRNAELSATGKSASAGQIHGFAVSIKLVGDVVVLAVSGRIAIGESAIFLGAIIEAFDPAVSSKVVVDLGSVSYIDSAGLGKLVSAYTRVTNAGGQLRLAGLKMSATRLTRAGFQIHVDETSAIRSFKTSPS